MFLLSVALQAVSASPPERVDLTIVQPCAEQRAAHGEVVVCASRDLESPYRLREVPAEDADAVPKAEVAIANGVTASAETESVDVGGFPSERLMLRLKVKF